MKPPYEIGKMLFSHDKTPRTKDGISKILQMLQTYRNNDGLYSGISVLINCLEYTNIPYEDVTLCSRYITALVTKYVAADGNFSDEIKSDVLLLIYRQLPGYSISNIDKAQEAYLPEFHRKLAAVNMDAKTCGLSWVERTTFRWKIKKYIIDDLADRLAQEIKGGKKLGLLDELKRESEPNATIPDSEDTEDTEDSVNESMVEVAATDQTELPAATNKTLDTNMKRVVAPALLSTALTCATILVAVNLPRNNVQTTSADVKTPEIEELTISSSYIALRPGQSQPIDVETIPDDADKSDINCTISNADIIKVDDLIVTARDEWDASADHNSTITLQGGRSDEGYVYVVVQPPTDQDPRLKFDFDALDDSSSSLDQGGENDD